MGYKGRIFAVIVVAFFNIFRYFYYHQYMGIPFKASFFILTAVFLVVAWIGGRQYDIAKFYAEKDPLTNTYNRRTVEKIFKRQTLICKKHNKKLGIILIDLDKFKDVNDKFGHQKGDELLKHVANIIKDNAKKDDFIIRWGGDEFLHIVPNIKEGFQFKYVQELKRELVHPKIAWNGASIGIAIFPDEGESLETLVQQADAAMYKMKAHRNSDVATVT